MLFVASGDLVCLRHSDCVSVLFNPRSLLGSHQGVGPEAIRQHHSLPEGVVLVVRFSQLGGPVDPKPGPVGGCDPPAGIDVGKGISMRGRNEEEMVRAIKTYGSREGRKGAGHTC